MKSSYEVTGTMTNSHTVKLDKDIPVSLGRVKLRVEPVHDNAKTSPREVLARIHARLRAGGHVPPTAEQIDKLIRTERESWERGSCEST